MAQFVSIVLQNRPFDFLRIGITLSLKTLTNPYIQYNFFFFFRSSLAALSWRTEKQRGRWVESGFISSSLRVGH